MTLRDRIYACFIGKNIGGTLGMPYEGTELRPDLSFYSPIPTEPAANDDLDLQLVWLKALETEHLKLNAEKLGEYWVKYIDVHWDEYGVAINNLRNGIKPPLSGLHNNNFTDGMGASIRSEIWAAAFAGKPLTAAWFALQDASVDHAGDGIYTEIYWAAVQAQLFADGNLSAAFQLGRSLLPEDSRFAQALDAVDLAYNLSLDAEEAREIVMKRFGSVNFTDTVMNNAITYLALKYGGGDFERTILIAANSGPDADCTAATAGAVIGIMQGIAGIPARWREVVGDDIKAGDYIKMDVPKTIVELTDRLVTLQESLPETNLPKVTTPVQLPKVDDFSENRQFKVNGQKIAFGGIKLDSSLYASQTTGQMVEFTTNLSFDFTGEVNIMIASLGLFIAKIDGKMVALKGDQARPVPAHHRVRGGRIVSLKVKKNQSYKLWITMYPTLPVPDMFVGCFDWGNRHVHANFKW